MNEKITLPTLVQLLAIASGDTKKQSEDFIKEFFSIISQALSEGEQVKIKDFGVFKTVVVDQRESVNVSTGERHLIPAHRKVVFVPAKEVAALVNSPFDMFEAVEIADELNIEDEEAPIAEVNTVENDSYDSSGEPELIQDTDISQETLLQNESEETQETEVSLIAPNQEQDNEESHLEDEPNEDAATVEEDAPTAEVESLTTEEEYPIAEAEHEAEEAIPVRKSRFGLGFLWGFVAAAVLCAIAFVGVFYFGIIDLPGVKSQKEPVAPIAQVENVSVPAQNVPDSVVESATVDSVKQNDAENNVAKAEEAKTAQSVPTEPSDKRVFDTITRTRYLTTMAKQHYGNFHLWPYIYIENQDFLGHPDRIRPGTKVVIPPLSKYGVNPNNPADIEKAKKKGVEIYSRYK